MRALLVALALLAAGPALAQSAPAPAPAADRRFGGCNVAGSICAGPTAAISVVGFSLKTGQFISGLIPGAGYGVTFNADKWYQVGIGGYAAIQTAPSTTGLFSLVLSFAEYLRIGVGYQILGSERQPLLLGGLGMDVGSTK